MHKQAKQAGVKRKAVLEAMLSTRLMAVHLDLS